QQRRSRRAVSSANSSRSSAPTSPTCSGTYRPPVRSSTSPTATIGSSSSSSERRRSRSAASVSGGTSPAVEVTGLTKVFEKGRRTIWQRLRREPDKREWFVAVNGIDLLVERGEIFGVLGAGIDAALVAVKLADRADDYVERYSTGMRQRLALARALLPDPPLVILDEPTVGLDPQAARDLRDRVRELKRQGRTVLLTTHYMEEADQLCDRIAIIDHGEIVALDSPAALKRRIRAE